MEKVYIVMASDAPMFGHNSWVYKVFTDKIMANKCYEVQEKLDEGYGYYVQEYEISTQELDTRIEKYYTYVFSTEFRNLDELIQQQEVCKEQIKDLNEPDLRDLVKQLNHPDNNFCNDEQCEECENRIYDKDLSCIVEDYGNYKFYSIYSINNYQEAKQYALGIWEKEYRDWEKNLVIPDSYKKVENFQNNT